MKKFAFSLKSTFSKSMSYKFQFKCEKSLKDLENTEIEDIKFCNDCDKKVYLCNTEEDVTKHSSQNHCVSLHNLKELSIGIDYGTKNIKFGLIDTKTKEFIPIPNRSKNIITPNIYTISQKGVFFGDERSEGISIHDLKTYFDGLQNNKFYKTKNIKVGIENNQVYFDLGVQLGIHTLLSLFKTSIKRITRDCELFLNRKVNNAVITVPYHYNDEMKEHLKIIIEECGLKVRRMLREPAASIIPCKIENRKVLLIDFGSTFRLFMLDIEDGVIDVLKMEKYDIYANDMIEMIKLNIKDMIKTNEIIREYSLENIAEDLKRNFIKNDKYSKKKDLQFLETMKTESVQFEISLLEYENICSPIYKEIESKAVEFIKNFSFDFDYYFTGGSIDLNIEKLMKNILKGKKEIIIDTDKILRTVQGASILSNIISNQTIGLIGLLDITLLSIGIECEGIFIPIISRNTLYPTKKSRLFSTTKLDQDFIEIKIYQGENKNASKNHLLKVINLNIKPNELSKIEITFDIDNNGLLNAKIEDKTSNNVLEMKIDYEITSKEIEKLIIEAENDKDPVVVVKKENKNRLKLI